MGLVSGLSSLQGIKPQYLLVSVCIQRSLIFLLNTFPPTKTVHYIIYVCHILRQGTVQFCRSFPIHVTKTFDSLKLADENIGEIHKSIHVLAFHDVWHT